MANQKIQRTQELAYEYWQRDGSPHGRDVDHWMEAERTLKASEKTGEKTAKPAAKKAAATKATSPKPIASKMAPKTAAAKTTAAKTKTPAKPSKAKH